MVIGRATSEVEVKTIESNGSSVVNFVIATNRKFTNKEWNIIEEAEYHRCVAYWNSADVLGKYMHKGKRIYIEWRLRTRKRDDASGITKYSTEVVANHFIFLDSKQDDGEAPLEIDIENEDVPF